LPRRPIDGTAARVRPALSVSFVPVFVLSVIDVLHR
jgi:hypothetical protein